MSFFVILLFFSLTIIVFRHYVPLLQWVHHVSCCHRHSDSLSGLGLFEVVVSAKTLQYSWPWIWIWTGFTMDTGMDMQPVSKGTDFYFIFNYFQSFSLFKLMFFLISLFSVTHHMSMTPWSTRSTITRWPHNIHNGNNDHDKGWDKGDKGRGLVLEMHCMGFFFPLLSRLD